MEFLKEKIAIHEIIPYIFLKKNAL